ncbi:MAG: hemerythrin domain-containing protein [Candidatus Dormibacteria bacterium]
MTETATYETETSDMLIPHNLFRSVFASADQVITGVRDGDSQKMAAVYSYFDNVLRFLDAHHGGEDACVWPLLSARCPEAAELLERMESEHDTIHRLREGAGHALAAWNASADRIQGRRFAEALTELGAEVDQHFAEEEVEILPLASRNMSPEEWGALPGHAMAHFSGDKIWLILGLIFEQMNKEELAFTFSLLPPPVVEMWTTSGEAAFKDFIGRVREAA